MIDTINSEDLLVDTLKYKRYGNGCVYWVNDEEELHRENGPAVEHADGTKEWYINGLRHREDGPAVEWSNGSKQWWVNGQLIRSSL